MGLYTTAGFIMEFMVPHNVKCTSICDNEFTFTCKRQLRMAMCAKSAKKGLPLSEGVANNVKTKQSKGAVY